MFSDLLQHRVSLYRQTNTQEVSSGGSVIAYALRQANIPCLIKGIPGGEQLRFAQQGIVVTHDIATSYSGARTGDKVTDDEGASYVLHSIRRQQGVGSIDSWWLWLGEQVLGE